MENVPPRPTVVANDVVMDCTSYTGDTDDDGTCSKRFRRSDDVNVDTVSHSTWYCTMASPPSFAGGSHCTSTWPLDTVSTATLTGIHGTWLTGASAFGVVRTVAPQPTAFMADTRK